MICLKYEKILSLESFIPECKGKISEYICPLCEGVYINPVIEGCGHIFCLNCIKQHLDHFSDCPQCGQKIVYSNFNTIKFVVDTIETQSIYCQNRNADCKWIGKYCFLQNHLNLCPKQIIKCQNDQCGFTLKREEFTSHLCPYLLIDCEKCKEKIQSKDIGTHICDIKEMNEINKSIDNAKFSDNSDQILLEDCIFIKFGCHIKINKLLITEHNSEYSYQHNQMLIIFLSDFHTTVLSRLTFLEENLKDFMTNHKFPNKEHIQSTSSNFDCNIFPNRNSSESSLDDSNDINKLINNKRIRYETENFTNEKEIKGLEWGVKSSFFDKENKSKGVIFFKNTVKYETKLKNQHAFAFLNIELDRKQTWKVKINKISYWIAIGVCQRTHVIKNNFLFSSNSDLLFNHSCFLLSSNSFIWNCQNNFENNKRIYSLPKFLENDEITLTYNFDEKQLNFAFARNTFTLSNVYSEDVLVPCAIMLSHGDELTFELK